MELKTVKKFFSKIFTLFLFLVLSNKVFAQVQPFYGGSIKDTVAIDPPDPRPEFFGFSSGGDEKILSIIVYFLLPLITIAVLVTGLVTLYFKKTRANANEAGGTSVPINRDRVTMIVFMIFTLCTFAFFGLKFQIGIEGLSQQIGMLESLIEAADKKIKILSDSNSQIFADLAVSKEAIKKIENQLPPAGFMSGADNSMATGSIFKLTANLYDISSDLNAAIASEFGTNYKVADWSDLKNKIQDDPQLFRLWADSLGLSEGGQALVLSDGQNYHQFPASCGPRHYFVQRDDADDAPGYFLVHDQIGNYNLLLGSWCDLKMKILAVKK
jgi:hypothetical protein